MEHFNETITLEIQGTSLKCRRCDLIQHSDYFKAMFKGYFIESTKNVIPLNGIEIEAMNIILKLLWDQEYIIDEENILSVLQAACMLQFLQVKDICIEQIENNLSIHNCLKIWLCAENLCLREVYCKAKLLALLEFMSIRDTSYFLDLNLDEVVSYLGNINLQCSREIIIFESVVKWYENLEERSLDILLKLLHCIDFTMIQEEQISEMVSSQSIVEYDILLNTFKSIIFIKNGNYDFKVGSIEYANSLLKSKNRNVNGFPCILIDNMEGQQSVTEKSTLSYYDKFKRKRKYNVVEGNQNNNFFVAYVDIKKHCVKKLFDIEAYKCEGLDGFKITGYRNLVFLFGGEYLLGKGDWNWNFFIYDLIKEKWRKKRLPFPRRHFESCICGKYLYIVCGTGPFRVIQENIFWYDIEQDEWSKEVKLPCLGRQIKCCQFRNQLFILNINNKCGYIFNPETAHWTSLEICDTSNNIPFFSKNLILFSYKSSLFIKESKLLELKIENNKLIIVNQKVFPGITESTREMESVLCNNIIYNLKKEESIGQTISLELFNVETNDFSDEILTVDREIFKFRSSLTIFSVFHPYLVEGNDAINVF